jgi:hypothetical protein
MNDSVPSLRQAPPVASLHAAFLAIVPRIELHGQVYFRHVRCPHRRADCVAEMVGLCWKWFVRLVERGKDPTCFPTTLATFAARHVRSGRRVCGTHRGKDALSPLAQTRDNFVVEKLPDVSTLSTNPFAEALRDNTVTPVCDQVQFRIDFPAWLATLTTRERRLIRAMARNERTLDLSKRFELSPARISQLRREFHDDWRRFLGDLDLA